MNALDIQNLTKTYPGFTLDNVSLTIPGGCVLGLIGENGAGKSTLIKSVLGMIRPDGGTVTILGNAKRTPLVMEDVGVVLDEVGIPSCLTTAQVGRVMAASFRNWDQAQYERYLKALALPEKKAFKDFSKGMKMKLGIAVALSHHARLLILDEATSGLDPVVRDEVLELLRHFVAQEDHAILMSSHIVSDLEKLCDYIAFVHKGKLLLVEEKDRLLEEYGLFLGSREDVDALPETAVRARRASPYGAEALVLREAMPQGSRVTPISIEELFVFMVKEGK